MKAADKLGPGYLARKKIRDYGYYIELASKKYNVDMNLIRAIIYEEQAHLFPPVIEDWLGGGTIGLGQMSVNNWRKYGCDPNDPDKRNDPAAAIDAIAAMLADIQAGLPEVLRDSIALIGARYNKTEGGLTQQAWDYGMRIKYYYDKGGWGGYYKP